MQPRWAWLLRVRHINISKMSNLLTPEYKKTLRRQKLIGLAYVYLMGFGIAGLFASTFLVPSYLLARSKNLTADRNLELIRASISAKENEAFGAILNEANRKIEILSEGDINFPANYEIIAKIIENKPNSLSIDNFSFASQGDEHSVSISGFSPTRQGLLDFQERLEGNDMFEEVDLPISYLASSRDVTFQMTVLVPAVDISEDQEKSDNVDLQRGTEDEVGEQSFQSATST